MKRPSFKIAALGAALLAVGLATGARAEVNPIQTVQTAIHANIVNNGGYISAVSVATDSPNHTTMSPTLIQMPGMATTVFVPFGHRALLLARFSAESACYGGGQRSNWCVAEIVVDGHEAAPGDGMDYAFDSTAGGTQRSDAWQGHSMDRSILVGPGFHRVQVLEAVTDFGHLKNQTFWTGERSLTVERSIL